ncbi:hypothetical protein AALO_G00229410, partial [Alosa alosa]
MYSVILQAPKGALCMRSIAKPTRPKCAGFLPACRCYLNQQGTDLQTQIISKDVIYFVRNRCPCTYLFFSFLNENYSQVRRTVVGVCL